MAGSLRSFQITTTHQWLFSLKDPNSKLVRWRLKLEEFDYEVLYKKGKANTNADALSRVEIHTKETFDKTDALDDSASLYNNPASTYYDPEADITPEDALQTIDKLFEEKVPEDELMTIDRIIEEIEQTTNQEAPIENDENDDETRHTTQENPIQGVPISEKPLNYYNNQIILKTVNYNPAKPVKEEKKCL